MAVAMGCAVGVAAGLAVVMRSAVRVTEASIECVYSVIMCVHV